MNKACDAPPQASRLKYCLQKRFPVITVLPGVVCKQFILLDRKVVNTANAYICSQISTLPHSFSVQRAPDINRWGAPASHLRGSYPIFVCQHDQIRITSCGPQLLKKFFILENFHQALDVLEVLGRVDRRNGKKQIRPLLRIIRVK